MQPRHSSAMPGPQAIDASAPPASLLSSCPALSGAHRSLTRDSTVCAASRACTSSCARAAAATWARRSASSAASSPYPCTAPSSAAEALSAARPTARAARAHRSGGGDSSSEMAAAVTSLDAAFCAAASTAATCSTLRGRGGEGAGEAVWACHGCRPCWLACRCYCSPSPLRPWPHSAALPAAPRHREQRSQVPHRVACTCAAMSRSR